MHNTAKQSKIIATISDLKCDVNFIRELYENGMDAIRLNTAHQTHEGTLKVMKNARKASDRIALMVDTKGPEIRTSKVPEAIIVKKGELIKFKGGKKEDISTRDLVYADYINFSKEIPKGTEILIDDAELALKVIKKEKDCIVCEVLNDGEIKDHKSINIPGVHINLPSLTERDKEYILFAIKNNADFISHSFVRNKEDVLAVQKILDKHKSPIKIVAKIENREGVDNIDEILDYVHAVVVARGDLAVEIPAEEVPMAQKRIIKKCIAKNKPVIVATQTLHTMIKNPRPTRAEVSDIANAVLDGADGFWLSGETAFGEYPIEVLETMVRVAKQAEIEKALSSHCAIISACPNSIVDYLAKSAATAAKELDIKGIVVSSKSGYSAELISSCRGNTPIILKCFDRKTVREFALTFGVEAQYISPKIKKENLISHVLKDLVDKKTFSKEDLVVFLSSDLKDRNTANSMEICKVGKYV